MSSNDHSFVTEGWNRRPGSAVPIQAYLRYLEFASSPFSFSTQFIPVQAALSIAGDVKPVESYMPEPSNLISFQSRSLKNNLRQHTKANTCVREHTTVCKTRFRTQPDIINKRQDFTASCAPPTIIHANRIPYKGFVLSEKLLPRRLLLWFVRHANSLFTRRTFQAWLKVALNSSGLELIDDLVGNASRKRCLTKYFVILQIGLSQVYKNFETCNEHRKAGETRSKRRAFRAWIDIICGWHVNFLRISTVVLLRRIMRANLVDWKRQTYFHLPWQRLAKLKQRSIALHVVDSANLFKSYSSVCKVVLRKVHRILVRNVLKSWQKSLCSAVNDKWHFLLRSVKLSNSSSVIAFQNMISCRNRAMERYIQRLFVRANLQEAVQLWTWACVTARKDRREINRLVKDKARTRSVRRGLVSWIEACDTVRSFEAGKRRELDHAHQNRLYLRNIFLSWRINVEADCGPARQEEQQLRGSLRECDCFVQTRAQSQLDGLCATQAQAGPANGAFQKQGWAPWPAGCAQITAGAWLQGSVGDETSRTGPHPGQFPAQKQRCTVLRNGITGSGHLWRTDVRQTVAADDADSARHGDVFDQAVVPSSSAASSEGAVISYLLDLTEKLESHVTCIGSILKTASVCLMRRGTHGGTQYCSENTSPASMLMSLRVCLNEFLLESQRQLARGMDAVCLVQLSDILRAWGSMLTQSIEACQRSTLAQPPAQKTDQTEVTQLQAQVLNLSQQLETKETEFARLHHVLQEAESALHVQILGSAGPGAATDRGGPREGESARAYRAEDSDSGHYGAGRESSVEGDMRMSDLVDHSDMGRPGYRGRLQQAAATGALEAVHVPANRTERPSAAEDVEVTRRAQSAGDVALLRQAAAATIDEARNAHTGQFDSAELGATRESRGGVGRLASSVTQPAAHGSSSSAAGGYEGHRKGSRREDECHNTAWQPLPTREAPHEPARRALSGRTARGGRADPQHDTLLAVPLRPRSRFAQFENFAVLMASLQRRTEDQNEDGLYFE